MLTSFEKNSKPWEKKMVKLFTYSEWLCMCGVHGDRLRFPWRTFNIRASTAADAREWMQLINWKLVRFLVIYAGMLRSRDQRQSRSHSSWSWSRPQSHGAVWFSLMKMKTKMVKNNKIPNLLTKTKTKEWRKLKREYRKRLKTKTKNWKRKCQNSKTCHSTKVLAYNMALTGATAVQRWIFD